MELTISDKDPLATELWQFALAFWQLPGTEDACLTLQQRGWSVTRLLCAGWLASHGRAYDGREPPELSQWRQQKTDTIRTLRRSISKQDGHLAVLRGLLAKAELESEKIELYRAWTWLQHEYPERSDRGQGMPLAQDNFRASAPPDEDTDSADIHHKITFLSKQVFRVC